MATWRVVERTGQTLVQLLERRFESEMSLAGVQVQLATTALFDELRSTRAPTVTLLLYHVSENAELRNSRPRVGQNGTIARQPLALELCYLVTPWGVRSQIDAATDETAAREEHRMLGVIMQAFYDHAELGRSELFDDPAQPVWRPIDSLQVVLESLPVEDHYRIWDASELAYRLSVTYRVRVVGLDPGETLAAGRVVDSAIEVTPRGARS